MMMDSLKQTQNLKYKPGWRVVLLAGLAVMIGIPGILLVCMSAFVNARKIPAELVKKPAYLAIEPGMPAETKRKAYRANDVHRNTEKPQNYHTTELSGALKFFLTHMEAPHRSTDWQPGWEPVTGDQAKALQSYYLRRTLDQIYDNLEKGDPQGLHLPARRTREETYVSKKDGKEYKFQIPDFKTRIQNSRFDGMVFRLSGEYERALIILIAADTRLALQDGRTDHALRSLQNLYRLARYYFDLIPQGATAYWYAIVGANGTLKYWIEHYPLEPRAAIQILNLIDPMASEILTKRILKDLLKLNMECTRPLFMQNFQQPWNTSYYGWDYEQNTHHFYRLTGKMEFPLPRFSVFATRAVKAMIRKTKATEYIEIYDANCRDWLGFADLDYPTQRERGGVALSPTVQGHVDPQWTIRPEFTEYWPLNIKSHRDQAELNLNRVALKWMADPSHRPPESAVDFKTHDDHPWRDPFTEKALELQTSGTLTTIYSLGPDLKDQQGMIPYDATNGSKAPGDFAIQVRSQDHDSF